MTDTRDRILVRACEMYLEDGLDGFSMRKLARALDVTPPALYRHFTSKEAVLRAVIAEAFGRFAYHLYRGLEGRTPQERLRLTGIGYVTFALEHTRFYEVIHLSQDLLGFNELPDEVCAQGAATRQFLIDRVRECMDAKVLSPDDPELVATAIWAFSHGLVSLHLGGILRMEREEFANFFGATISRLFQGIGGEAYVPPAPLEWIRPSVIEA